MSACEAAALTRLLYADGPAPDRADKMGLYGWLIGAWEIDAIRPTPDGRTHARKGEIAFAWAFGGRAIVDVWTLPDVFHGVTLRIYDPGIDAWHIIWSDALKPYLSRQIGRARGRDIVQIGQDMDGCDTRWSFVDIERDSFRWLGERSTDGRASWSLQAEYCCRRI